MAAKAYDTFKGHKIMFVGSVLMALMMGLIPFVTCKKNLERIISESIEFLLTIRLFFTHFYSLVSNF